jgi:hypothetical protein
MARRNDQHRQRQDEGADFQSDDHEAVSEADQPAWLSNQHRTDIVQSGSVENTNVRSL